MSVAAPVIALTSTGNPHADATMCSSGATATPVMPALLDANPNPAGGGAVQLIVIVSSTVLVFGSMRAIRGLPDGATPGTVTQNRLRPGSQSGCSSPPAFAKEMTLTME